MRLIDADELIENLSVVIEIGNEERRYRPDAKKEKYLEILKLVVGVIEEEPTLSPSSLVNRGRWETEPCNHKPSRIKNRDKWVIYMCSECGNSNGRKKSKYCCACGAMMED